MNAFLITYEYSYNEEPGKFTEVVEGESYAAASKNFKAENNTATILDIKQLEHANSSYVDLKNYIHNATGISKEDVRDMVEKAVDNVVGRKLEVMFHKYWLGGSEPEGDYSLWTLERVVDAAIREKGLRYWDDSKDSFDDYIKEQVVQELLRGVKLKVDIAKNNKEATKPSGLRLRKSK